MEEDEEVLLENSRVHLHLRDSGFYDVETKAVGNAFSYKYRKYDTGAPKRIVENYSVLEEISAIKSTNLLFEDDLNHIDNVLANIKLNENEQLRYVFMGSACAIVLAIGLCLYLIIGYYAIFLISIYYTYRASDYLWKRHKRLRMLHNLINAIKCNFSLLNKVLKFLHENENMLKTRFCEKENEIASKRLHTLKNNLLVFERRVNKLFLDTTASLLNDLPLLDHIDDEEGYICRAIEPVHDSENISQLYNMYMLLQSQFLTRLTFSIVPSLLLNPGDSYLKMYKTMYKISAHLKELNAVLDKEFKHVLYNGIYVDKNKSARPLGRSKPHRNPSVQMLAKNVHDLSNSLQYSLIKARALETNLEDDTAVNTGKELEDIHIELALCQSHISDLLILQKQSQYSLTKQNMDHEDSDNKECEFATVTEVGYSDLDPTVDDDIFEAIISGAPEVREILCNDEELVDPLAKKKRKVMLDELKCKLKGKAEEWSQRESLIRARKGLPITEELPIQEIVSTDFAEWERPGKTTYPEKYGDSSSDEEFEPNIEFQQALLLMNKNFVPQTEYYICDNSEDSD